MVKRLVVLALVAYVSAAVALFVVPHGDKAIKADAVFVLSGSSKRLPVGLRLVHEGYAPLLVVSRSASHPSALEVEACAHKLGVQVLCYSAKPFSTVGEAELLGALAARNHWGTVDAVTSQYHVVRARMLLERCFPGRLRVVAAPDNLKLLPLDVVLESVKLPYHELVHRGC